MQYLTDADIEGLHHTSQGSFYYEHIDFFEIVKGNKQDAAKDGEGTMLWYATHLEGLIAFNYYVTKYKAVLLWDMAEKPEPLHRRWQTPEHCVIIDKKFGV